MGSSAAGRKPIKKPRTAVPNGARHARFFICSINWSKGILGQSAYGAYPIFGNILPGGARSDASIGIALRRVVDITAGAFIFGHE